MRFALDVLPAAIADIVEAARWYEDQRGGVGRPVYIGGQQNH